MLYDKVAGANYLTLVCKDNNVCEMIHEQKCL